MAHFKRGKCRRNCPRAIRGSTASWRARHGFKPVRPPTFEAMFPEADAAYWTDRGLWRAAWDEHNRICYEQPGKSHLSQMNGAPAWWDRTFHTRPKRAQARRLEQAIVRGQLDPDGIVWPLANRKPTIYYW